MRRPHATRLDKQLLSTQSCYGEKNAPSQTCLEGVMAMCDEGGKRHAPMIGSDEVAPGRSCQKVDAALGVMHDLCG